MNMVSGKIPTKTFVTTKTYSETLTFKNDITAELGIIYCGQQKGY